MKGSFNSEAAAIQKPQVQLNCCCQADGALIRISYLQPYCLAARVGLVLSHLSRKGKGRDGSCWSAISSWEKCSILKLFLQMKNQASKEQQ